MNFYALAAGILFAATSSIAHAELIERTFDIMASNFQFEGGNGPNTPAAVDPVELNFTIIFNTSGVTGPTAKGLTINSFTLPNPPYASAFFYGEPGPQLIVATYPAEGGFCVASPNSYCVFIADAAGATPSVAGSFTEETSSGGDWASQSTILTASAITIVPEPSTWALMLAGFSGLGWFAFRRRHAIGAVP